MTRARPLWAQRAQIVCLALLLLAGLLAAVPVWDGAYPVTRITLLPQGTGFADAVYEHSTTASEFLAAHRV